MKTRRELIDYAYTKYPDSGTKKQIITNMMFRLAMDEAWLFISGAHDESEERRKKIAESIFNKIIKEGL